MTLRLCTEKQKPQNAGSNPAHPVRTTGGCGVVGSTMPVPRQAEVRVRISATPGGRKGTMTKNTFEYQVTYMNGKKSKWGPWFSLETALAEIVYYFSSGRGEFIVKRIVIRRIKNKGGKNV